MHIKQQSHFRRKVYLTFLFILCVSLKIVYSQNHPGTGTIRTAGSCVPTGWSLDVGSPDVSDATGWGFKGSLASCDSSAGTTAWKNTILPPPNGETRWLSAHSTEQASMIITGLTVGTSYTLEFYYMTAIVTNPQIGGYGGILSTKIRYSIDGGAMISKPIVAGDTWYKETVTFTATATTSKFTYYGGDHDGFFPGNAATEGDLTNISFKPNGTVPANSCPTINLTSTPMVTICNGQSAVLTATGPSATNYTYTWLPSGSGTTITVSPTDTIGYQVTVDSAGCKKTANSIVIVNPVPVVTATSSTVCPGQTATLTASGAASYTWSPGTNLSATTGASVNSTPPGNITYTVTGTSDGCSATAISSVTIAGSIPISVNSSTVCPGQTATLIASGGTTYSWSPATNLSATTGASVNSTPPGNITYTVTGTTNGCSGTAVSTVTIAGSIPISVNSETICTGATATLTASGGTTYSWSDASTANPKTVSPGATTSYTVTGTTNGCSGTAVATVTISPALTVTVTSTSVCSGVSATLTAGGATTYVWSDGSTAGTLTASPVTPTSYTVTGTSNGCTGTGVGTINIITKDDASFSYTPSTVCKTGGTDPSPVITGTTGGTFSCTDGALVLNSSTGVITLASTPIGTYTVTYTTAGTCPDSKTYVIAIVNVPDATFSYAGPYCQNVLPNPLPTFPSGSSAGVFTGSPAGLNFTNSGTGEVNLVGSTPNSYTVTNTIAAGGGCPAATYTNTITINAVPVTTVNNQTVCGGVPATLTAGGATTYLWSDGSTAGTLTAAPLTTTPYTVTGTTAGCSSSAVGTITANPIPTVTVNSATVCAGTAATLTASGATSYSWSDGSSASSLTASPGTTTPYTVTGTSAGCSSSASGTITVNPMPTVTVNSLAICAGQSATLTAAGANTYVWSDATTANPKTVSPGTTTPYTVVGTSAGCSGTAVSTVTVNQVPVITVNSPTICSGASTTLTAVGGSAYVWSNGGAGASITVSPASTTPYTVSDNTAGCSGSAVSTVTVNTPPTVTVNSAIICIGQSATLTASGASSYLWSNGSVANSITVSPVTPTSYTVIGNPGGCSGSAVTTITVMPLPVITVNSATVCAGSPATLTAAGGTSYVWSTGSVTASTTVSPAVTTSYTVTGTGGGCSNTAVGTVTAFPIPTAGFSSSPNPVGVLSPVITFTDRSSSDVNSWSWSFGDGDSLAGTQNPVHTYPSVETTYTVTLNVANAGLCINSISHTVIVGPEFSFYIPNAFSPNDDQKNDVFFGSGTGINKYKLLIFDRWGNQIFKTEELSGTWNGKANGGAEVAQQDVYVWRVIITDVFKKEHEFLGTVTIVK